MPVVFYCADPVCRKRFQHTGKHRPTHCPACRKARSRRSGKTASRKADASRAARLEARLEPRVSTAPHLQVPLDQLIRDADAASARALKAAANPGDIEPRPKPEPGLSFSEKVELVMLYGDVTPEQRNKWLLGRTSSAYVDYFADDGAVAPATDAEDKEVLAGLLGLPADQD